MDSNKDDTIHYTDFLAAMCTSRIRMHEDLILQAFRRFDTDNSGKISMQNLREVLGDSSYMEAFQEVRHEGNQIEYADFLAYLRDPEVDERTAEAAAKLIDGEMQREGTPA